jgi:uncharacterized membrane protein
MTLFAIIAIPSTPWIWPAGVLVLAALAMIVWSYRRAARLRNSRFDIRISSLVVLKLLGITVLALCLIEPLWSGRRAKSGANLFVIAADNSSGMNIRDIGADRSRGEILRDLLESGRESWLAALAGSYQVRPYLFDSRLHRTTDFSDLAFDGKATALGTSLQTLAGRFQGRPLAGILLMTDGCATDGEVPNFESRISNSEGPLGLPPVYPVVIGGGRTPRDLSLTNIAVSQTAFEDAPVTIQANVEAAGFAGQSVEVDLLNDAGSLIERQRLSVDEKEERQAVRFRLRPDRTGVLFYRLRVSEVGSDASVAQSQVLSEATLANNERTVVVDRGKGPYRILYVAGRPNWEFKYLKRAEEEDEQVQLVALLRVARREPKYDWRGHVGETSNPLYRGLDANDQKEAERYDQPVLVRLNTRDQAELSGGFPKTAEEMFEYHAIILDDVEAEFFSRDQMDLLRRFVAERGGGFLMLGGKESFQRGNFQRTPIAGMLPVYLDPARPDSPAASVRMQLTRAGWLQPWARLRDKEDEERQRLAQMPEFRVFNRVGSARPGGRVIGAVGEDESQQTPALVVQRLGNGRTAMLAVGDVWRWGMQKPQAHEDMDKFWRQLLRWLVTDVPGRISLQAVQRADGAGQSAVLQVRVRDKSFEPAHNISIALEVDEPNAAGTEPGRRRVQLTAAPAPAESGLFEAAYVPRTSGGYLARVAVTDAAGSKVGDAEAGWTADLEAREFRSVKANRPLLEKIARGTGGRVVEIDELDEFARRLPRRDVPIMEVWTRPLWDLPGVLPAIFLFVLACFVAEWAIRRWRGLP